MYNYNENFRRLPLNNVHNLRDLGGYAAEDYSITKWHCFLRSDNVYNITEEEREFLIGYGLTTVIDLRSADEIIDKPNPFLRDEIINYYNIPLLNQNMSDIIDTANNDIVNAFKLGDLYVAIAERSKVALRKVFDILIDDQSKCTIFHCTAGKDRTGVITALLLSLVGVDFEDILANYEVTNTHLRKIYKDIKYVAPEVPISMIESRPENIEQFLNHILSKYGTTEKYLLTLGLTANDISALKDKFLKR